MPEYWNRWIWRPVKVSSDAPLAANAQATPVLVLVEAPSRMALP
jgi:hypothetical protein